MRSILLALAALVALAALPGAQATSVWACVNNTACGGAGAGVQGATVYADACLFPVVGCQFVSSPALPIPPGVYPGPICQSVVNPPVVLVVCAAG